MSTKQFSDWTGRIIWSADGLDWPSLEAILRREDFPRDQVAVKLDRLFLTRYGLNTIGWVQEKIGVPVFADAKIVEIPSKTMELVKLHLEQQPWMLNVMAQIANTGVNPSMREKRITDDELDVLNQFATECKQAGTKPCVVTVLTSKTDSLAEYEYNVTTNEAVFSYVSLAIGCGVTDIVCSPKEAEFLRQATGWPEYMRLNTPGVRLASSSKDDQERVMTPGEALFKGADRLVIGRDLSRNREFKENLENILADIQAWEQK